MMETGRLLNPDQGIKPLDFGGDGVVGSVDSSGRLIALNTYHPQHGFVSLTVADPFPEERRYNPAAVRRYRAGLAQLDGFGPFGRVTQRTAALLADAIPQVRLTFNDGRRAVMTAWAQGGGAFQCWECDSPLTWQGRLSLQRCAYTQLTEGGPVPMPPAETLARFVDGVLTIENPALSWTAAIAGFPSGASWERRAHGPLEIEIAGQPGVTTLAYGFGPTASAAREAVQRLSQDPASRLDAAVQGWTAHFEGAPDDLVIRRGLSYGLMLAVPVGGACCLLTDHMLLPLSWNRDAYYVASALLHWRAELADVVRRHLLWIFEVAERRDGVWGRCYLANGRIKDAAFQLDQQLFPLLELVEYVQHTGDIATWERLRPAVTALVETLISRKAPAAWLFPTDETPADDPLALPYHFSSHILMWYTLRQFGTLTGDARLLTEADALRQAAFEHFTAARGGRTLYAYATDGAGHFHFYHDANDIPLMMAPVWGFTTVEDPVWRATVDFAFSADNEGGYYAGRLGSIHTRAPWPLGDVQELMLARLLDNAPRKGQAWSHLHAAARWDGALPEAVHAETNEVVSRHWFAWPNAVLACVEFGILRRSE